MASQQAIFAETIAGLRRTAKRRVEDWDSDSSLEHLTNRGNKLRKRARFVREGQLAPPTGPRAYTSQVEHAGHRREILSKKPPLVDEDGYEVDSEDDDERAQTAALEAAEFDPYAGVRIEYILAPLTAASDLPHHSTLSQPFTSKTLTELTRHAGEILQKERASLWRVKHLLTRLSGDDIWIPCGVVESENDISYFTEQLEQHSAISEPKERMEANRQATSEEQAKVPTTHQPGPSSRETAANNDPSCGERGGDAMLQIEHDGPGRNVPLVDASLKDAVEGRPSSNGISGNPGPHENGRDDMVLEIDDHTSTNPGLKAPLDPPLTEGNEVVDGDTLMEDSEEAPVPRRMRTRAQAQAASDNFTSSRMVSASPDFEEDLLVHPLFLAPKASHPDRDMGLPQQEAEETRRLLQLYVQKQEEICRSAQKVYEGLLRADRLRHTVMKWAKAEAHVGLNRDMSDGEDWYDREEWGLEEDLKKGHDEDEEDATTTAKKTTRARRQ